MAIIRRVLSLISTVIGVLFFALILIPLIGPPLYLEARGSSAVGTITAKNEEIRIVTDNWSRSLSVGVRFQASNIDEPVETNIRVNAATYDQLHVSDAVPLRYVLYPFLRDFGNISTARLEAQPPFGSFTAAGGSFLLWLGVGIVVWVALLMAFSKRQSWWIGVPILALMVGAGLYLGSGWPGPAPSGPRATSSATVHRTYEVTRVWGGRRTASEEAVQPYTIVELSFVPQGATDPVRAVDMIDAGSVQGLAEGAAVPISYSTRDPRWVQITGANRTYYWKNLRTFGFLALFLVVLFVGSRLFLRRRSRRSRLAIP